MFLWWIHNFSAWILISGKQYMGICVSATWNNHPVHDFPEITEDLPVWHLHLLLYWSWTESSLLFFIVSYWSIAKYWTFFKGILVTIAHFGLKTLCSPHGQRYVQCHYWYLKYISNYHHQIRNPSMAESTEKVKDNWPL